MSSPVVGADSQIAASDLERALERLADLQAEAGYASVSPPHLFPAELLLDLYGEDIRGRAFLFPGGGVGQELCLRPDFTVPVALTHRARGWDRPARYAYQGPVFRRQEPGSNRPIEYLQAGIESLGASDRATADSQVLSLILKGLAELDAGPVVVTTGDLGIAFALLDALDMPDRRRMRLRRHFWRPERFRRLLRQAVEGPGQPSELRRAVLDATRGDGSLDALAAEAGEVMGRRTLADLRLRAEALALAAGDPPMPADQATLIEQVTEIAGPSGEALRRLHQLTAEADADITPALDRFEARLDALNRAGIDAEDLRFDANFGRNLEYYDGFVFEVLAEGRPDLPPLAGGGRYDAMTLKLGAQRAVPAVGAMIRPEAALTARGQR